MSHILIERLDNAGLAGSARIGCRIPARSSLHNRAWTQAISGTIVHPAPHSRTMTAAGHRMALLRTLYRTQSSHFDKSEQRLRVCKLASRGASSEPANITILRPGLRVFIMAPLTHHGSKLKTVLTLPHWAPGKGIELRPVRTLRYGVWWSSVLTVSSPCSV